MAEKINLATLDLDVQGLIKSAAQSKDALLALRTEQAELKKAGQESSPQFIRNEVEIKNLSAAYRAQTTAIQAQVSEGGRLVNANDAIKEAVDRLNLSENEFRANNTLLIKQRKDLKITDADYQKNLDSINKKINENNNWIKENVSAYEQQKIGIGGYSEGIKSAIKDTGIFNGALGALGGDADGVINVVKSFTPVLNDLHAKFTETIKNMGLFKKAEEAVTVESEAAAASSQTLAAAQSVQATETAVLTASTETLVAIEGVAATEAALLTGETAALAATQTVQAGTSVAAAGGTGVLSAALIFLQLVLDALGIGLIIAFFVILIAAFKSFTPLVDKLEQGMAALGAVFNVLTNAAIALFTGTKSLSSIFSGLSDDMDEAAASAVKLKKAQQDLEDAMALQEIQSARNRAEINRLNVQAKDRTKSEEERLSLLQKASDLEDKDFKQRKKNADEELRIALEQIRLDADLTDAEFAQLKKQGLNYKEYVEEKTNGVDDLFDKLKEAQLKEIDLDNEYYTNQEKNINKQNKLLEDAEKERESLAAKKEKDQEAAVKAEQDRQNRIQKALDDYTESLKLQLELFRQVQGEKADSVDEEIANAQRIKEQQDKIAKAAYDASKKTNNDKLKLQIAYNDSAKQLADSQTSAIVKAADVELEHILSINKSKLDNNKFLTDELVNQEVERLNRIAEAEKDNAIVRMEAEKKSQQEINDALFAIDSENEAKKQAIIQQRKEAQKAAEIIDLDNKRIAQGESFLYDLDAQLAEYDAKRAIEKEQQLAKGADEVAFDKATAEQRKNIEKSVQDNKFALASNTFAQLSNLLGKESAAGKALAIAQTTMDTYRGATAAYAALAGIVPAGPVLGTIAAGVAIATGLGNVQKIVSTKTPKAERGALFGIGGKRHSQGGTLFTGEDGTRFEAEQGELIGVMNRNAAAHFMAFNNAFPSGGASVSPTSYLATGGIADRANAGLNVDYDILAAKIGAATAAANLSLPAPVVAVQDIAAVSNQMVYVQEFASH
jgi:hypothetical protein